MASCQRHRTSKPLPKGWSSNRDILTASVNHKRHKAYDQQSVGNLEIISCIIQAVTYLWWPGWVLIYAVGLQRFWSGKVGSFCQNRLGSSMIPLFLASVGSYPLTWVATLVCKKWSVLVRIVSADWPLTCIHSQGIWLVTYLSAGLTQTTMSGTNINQFIFQRPSRMSSLVGYIPSAIGDIPSIISHHRCI